MSVHSVLYIVSVHCVLYIKLTVAFSCDLGSLGSMSGLVLLTEVSNSLVCDIVYWPIPLSCDIVYGPIPMSYDKVDEPIPLSCDIVDEPTPLSCDIVYLLSFGSLSAEYSKNTRVTKLAS